MALTLVFAGSWFWRSGLDASLAQRRRAALAVAVVLAVNAFVNSVWLGVLDEGSLRAALTPLGWATAIVSALVCFAIGLFLSW
ncbi:MAG: hypothetical protein LLG24_05225, partial [Actinomycetia bacterium]|nr:hypothetical protein [Actinomycetes bacterium]